MPLTNAERKRRYVEKLKENGLFDSYKAKKAFSAKQRRAQIKRGLEKLPKAVRERSIRANRAYTRERVKEYRRRKKLNQGEISNDITSQYHTLQSQNVEILEQPYKTASALWKAVAKVKEALPSSSIKKNAVLKKLLQSFDVKDQHDILRDFLIKTEETQAVSSTNSDPLQSLYLYEGDDISRMPANTKNYIKVEPLYERDDVSGMSFTTTDSREFVDPVTMWKIKIE